MSKNEKGLMDTDNNVVIVGVGHVRGLNGSEKNTIKFKEKYKVLLESD